MLLLKKEWSRQPQTHVKINTTNPITQNLSFVVNPGTGYFEYIRNTRLELGGTFIKPSKFGVGIQATTNASVAANCLLPNFSTSNGAYTGDFTVFVISSPISSTTREFLLSYTNGAQEFYFGANHNVALTASAGAVTGATNITAPQGVTAAGMADGLPHAYGFSRDAAISSARLYRDGILANSGAMTPRAIGTSASILRIAGYSSANWGTSSPVVIAVGWNRALSAQEHASIAANPWQIFLPVFVNIPQIIVSGAYILNAETGAYTFTGSDATLIHNYALTLESASYSLTGSNATLLKGLILDAASGSYTLTGSDATFVYNKLLNASSGSYSVTGADANLIYTPGAGAYTLNAESGAYLLTGSDVTFAYSGGLITLKAGSWIRYRIIT